MDDGRSDRDNDDWGRESRGGWSKSRDDDDYRGGGGYSSPRSRPGDWNCGECQFNNFASRNSCYKCNASKDDRLSHSDGGMSRGGGNARPGDWECSSCQFSNFAFRDTCFKCNGSKGGGGGGGGRSRYGGGGDRGGGGGGGRHPGDWDCPECQFMNFGSRDECLKCRARRGGLWLCYCVWG